MSSLKEYRMFVERTRSLLDAVKRTTNNMEAAFRSVPAALQESDSSFAAIRDHCSKFDLTASRHGRSVEGEKRTTLRVVPPPTASPSLRSANQPESLRRNGDAAWLYGNGIKTLEEEVGRQRYIASDQDFKRTLDSLYHERQRLMVEGKKVVHALKIFGGSKVKKLRLDLLQSKSKGASGRLEVKVAKAGVKLQQKVSKYKSMTTSFEEQCLTFSRKMVEFLERYVPAMAADSVEFSRAMERAFGPINVSQLGGDAESTWQPSPEPRTSLPFGTAQGDVSYTACIVPLPCGYVGAPACPEEDKDGCDGTPRTTIHA